MSQNPYRAICDFALRVHQEESERFDQQGGRPQSPQVWEPQFREREAELTALVKAGIAAADRTGFAVQEVERRLKALAKETFAVLLWQRDAARFTAEQIAEERERYAGMLSSQPKTGPYLAEHRAKVLELWADVETLAVRLEAASSEPPATIPTPFGARATAQSSGDTRPATSEQVARIVKKTARFLHGLRESYLVEGMAPPSLLPEIVASRLPDLLDFYWHWELAMNPERNPLDFMLPNGVRPHLIATTPPWPDSVGVLRSLQALHGIPREQLRIDDLSRQIKSEGYDVPRDRLGAEPWSLEPLGATALMEKIKGAGVPLRDFAGVRPLLGIKTALNEAFLLDDDTRKRLVGLDCNSDAIIRPYLRGQDIDRWGANWAGCWMIVLKSSNDFAWPWSDGAENAEAIFKRTYPSVFDHLNQFRAAAIKRQDQGKFWWELRSCAFWDAFKSPKIWFQQIQFHPSYALDAGELYGNNKTTFLPCSDLFLLAALNSPLIWWYNYRFLPHMKDEALAPVNYKVEEIPIAKPSDETRAAVESAVRRLIDITAEQQAGRRAMLDWLRLEFGVEKASQKLQDVARLDADALANEVRKARGKKNPLWVADVKRLKQEHAATVTPLQTLAAEALELERRVSDLVNAAYGLTPDEIKLMWDTAPPRMPLAAPPG